MRLGEPSHNLFLLQAHWRQEFPNPGCDGVQAEIDLGRRTEQDRAVSEVSEDRSRTRPWQYQVVSAQAGSEWLEPTCNHQLELSAGADPYSTASTSLAGGNTNPPRRLWRETATKCRHYPTTWVWRQDQRARNLPSSSLPSGCLQVPGWHLGRLLPAGTNLCRACFSLLLTNAEGSRRYSDPGRMLGRTRDRS